MLNNFLVLGQVPGTNVYLNIWDISGIALALTSFALIRYRKLLAPYYVKSWRLVLSQRKRLSFHWPKRLPVQLKLF